MKILMVHKTKKGGVAVVVRETKAALKKKGHVVDEITRNEDLGFNRFYTSHGKMKRFFKKMSAKYDVIHTHDWSITYPAIKSGIPNLVATFHGFPFNPIQSYFQKYATAALGKRAMVVSPVMKKQYPGATVVANAVNMTAFKPSKKKIKKIVVGMAQAYNATEVKAITQKLGLQFRQANVPHNKMPSFYNSINVFVSIPPASTGFNMVWVEAMASSVPYIIGTNDGIGHALPILKVTSMTDLESLLTKIKNKAVKPLKNQRTWLAANGFSWEKNIKKLEQIYKAI